MLEEFEEVDVEGPVLVVDVEELMPVQGNIEIKYKILDIWLRKLLMVIKHLAILAEYYWLFTLIS